MVSAVSEPLFALMNNGMLESKRGSAWLEDVDEGTFARFSEWVYAKNYSAAPPRKVEGASGLELNQESSKGKREKQPAALRTYPEDVPMLAGLFEEFSLAEQGFCEANIKIEPASDPDIDQGPNHEYLEHFLSHARLYVFADQRQIAPLKELTASRLKTALVGFRYYNQRAEDVAHLIEYVYENTTSLKSSDDVLRRTLVEHAALQFENLTSTPVFTKLLEEGGQFVKDLCWKTAERLGKSPYSSSGRRY